MVDIGGWVGDKGGWPVVKEPADMNASHQNFWAIALMMVASGIGIPVLASWNASLGQQLASPPAATFVLFAVGFLVSGVIVAIVGLPPLSAFPGDRPYRYFSAGFMIFYALAVTWSAPRIGIGNAVFFVLLGQIIAAAAIDQFGLWGAPVSPLGIKRVAGIAVMAVGLFLARKPV